MTFASYTNNKIFSDFTLFDKPELPSIHCLIVLNNDINPSELSMLVQASQNIILADGGCNHFYESKYRDCDKLRVIVGDLDSAKPEILKYYEEKGVKVQKIQNQDINDFHKAISLAITFKWTQIVCLGPFGDRMDQTLSSMSVSTNIMRNNKEIQIVLFGRNSLMYLIRPKTKYEIKMGDWADKEGCGLIPFGKVNLIETKGFKWNLGEKEAFNSLEWGEFISTSNEIVGESVEIESSDEIFFVCQFKKQMI